MNRDHPTRGRKILCVDDDAYLTDLMRYALSREGYVVQIANSAAAALRALRVHTPDLVTLDLNLPDADGLELCTRLRTEWRLPVIILSGRHSEDDIVRGFDHGADDYITKPFSMHVLVYRMEAVLRRANPAQTQCRAKRLLRVQDGWFDTEQQQVSRGGERVKLTTTEGKIFYLLMMNEGQVLSAERILDEIWDYDSETNASVIKTHIRYLRAKLATLFGDAELIHTVRGVGYTYRRAQASLPLDEGAGIVNPGQGAGQGGVLLRGSAGNGHGGSNPALRAPGEGRGGSNPVPHAPETRLGGSNPVLLQRNPGAVGR